MATFTLDNTPYPNGTSVGAYDATGWTGGFPGANPPGVPVETQVADDFAVTFEDVEYDTPYIAAGKVAGAWRYIRFTPQEAIGVEIASKGEVAERQPLDADLTALAGLAPKDGAILVRTGGSWAALDIGDDGQMLVVRSDGTVAYMDPPEIYVDAWEAKGDGVTDNSEPIDNAISATGGFPAKLKFGRGEYKFSTPPTSLKRRTNIVLEGGGGLSGGSAPTTALVYTGGNTTRVLDFRSSSGCRVKGMGLYYSDPAFVGWLIDLSHDNEGGESDCSHFEADDLLLAGKGIRTGKGVNLNKAILSTFRRVTFMNLDIGAKGLEVGEGGASYSGAYFERCFCVGIGTIPFRNPGGWAFKACISEPLNNGKAGFIDYEEGSHVGTPVSFDACEFLDTSVEGGTWLKLNAFGISVKACVFGGKPLETTAIQISAASHGVYIGGGTRFDTFKVGVEILDGCTEFVVDSRACLFSTVTTKVTLDAGATDAGGGYVSDSSPDGLPGVIAPNGFGEIPIAEFALVKEKAFAVRFTVPKKIKATQLRFVVTTAAGSNDPVEVAIYKGSSKKRVVTSGEQAGKLNGLGLQTVEIAPTILSPNVVYYATIVCKAIGSTAAKLSSTAWLQNGFANIFGGTSVWPKGLTGFKEGVAALPEEFATGGGVAQAPIIYVGSE